MDPVEKMYKKLEQEKAAFNREFGAEINKAIPMYEDPTRYPVEKLVELFHFQWNLKDEHTPYEKAVLKKEFARRRDMIKPFENAPERIYLYKGRNIPTETIYKENPDYLYDHDPDFKPYYLEMLVSNYVYPIGGIVLVAGGSHGAGTINECYQIGREFNALGYQCFILQCRPHRNPWSRKETAADAARALHMIRANAKKYRIDPNHLAFAGFSNGGVTGDACIEYYSENQQIQDYFPDYTPDACDAQYGAPNAFVCVYGVRHLGTPLSREKFAYPPTFISIGREDKVCMQNLYGFLPWALDNDVPLEIHTYAGHPHGFAGWKIIDGKGDPNFDLWVTHADCFLKDLFAEYDPKLSDRNPSKNA